MSSPTHEHHPGTLLQARELILASAGSGKTFRISSRIIGLLARGEPVASIFASTFTRKAAGEILDRVLVRLAEGATDPASARSLAELAAGDGVASPAAETVGFWQEVLHRTVRDLHRLDVGTLDAFFVRTVRGFAHDLGLPPGWGIADEPTEDRLRSDALGEILRTVDSAALVELLRSLHSGGVRRSVHESLARDVDAILEAHLSLAPDAPGWKAMAGVPREPVDDLDARCRTLAARIRGAEVPFTKKGAPHSGWRKATEQAAQLVEDRLWEKLVSAGLGKAALTAGSHAAPVFYGSEFPEELRSVVEDALRLARSDLAAMLDGRARAMGRLARAFEKTWMEALLQAGLLRFNDVTRLLTGAGVEPGAHSLPGRGDLFYRLDSETRHVLLDEFQDTSLLQWQALVPLLDRLAGSPGSPGMGATVVVADPKQSIYGWRGAAPIVVEALGDRYGLPREDMAESWRSSQVVLDAVNRVFQDVDRAPVLAREPRDAAVAGAWGDAFRPHRTAEARGALPGRVRLLAGPEREGKAQSQPHLMRFAAEHVRGLHDEAPGCTIGVLTRRNESVAQLIFELGQLGVPASEEGGTRLTDSASVVSLLALLRMTDHPVDRLARYHVARTPVGEAMGFTDEGRDDLAWRISERLRRRLVDVGYGPTLSKLGDRIRNDCDPREWKRLRRLVELGYRWDELLTGPGLRVDDFVRLAEAERAESPGEDLVRVMTIHRAKGLEFDVVVLPELYGSAFSARRESAPLVYRPGGTGPVTHAFPPLSSTLVTLFQHVDEIRLADDQTRAAGTRDALGALYVAMTRARYALDMIVPGDGEKGPGSERSHARLLRERLTPETAEDRAIARQTLYDVGDREWFSDVLHGARVGRGPRASVPERVTLRRAEVRSRNLERLTPSGAEGGGAPRLEDLLGLAGGAEARLRGTLVHDWLEELEWFEDGLPAQSELLRSARRSVPGLTEDRVMDTLRWLEDRLAQPSIQAVLSRAHWPDGATLERELPFLLRRGDTLVEGIVDRLVLVREGSSVIQADVLDYKTDRVEVDMTGALDRRVDFYAPQITAYRDAVATLYRLDPQNVSGRLIFLDAGVVRDL
jgi:ATP-dependent exoDNAse (exonuclease V) beta subunit